MQFIPKIRTILQKNLIKLIDDVSLLSFGISFIGIVFSFACIYYALTPSWNGIVQNELPVQQNLFWNSLYFSLVTVSSLGYGDISPVGYSKVFACGEVLFGLFFMGVIIAKITSIRLSYHVKRLFNSDAQRRLEQYSINFERLRTEMKSIVPKLGDAFQEIPGMQHPEIIPEASDLFHKMVSSLNINILSYSDYILYETEHGDFFKDAPKDALDRTADAIDDYLFGFGQLILSLPPAGKSTLLIKQTRRQIAEALDYLKIVQSKIMVVCKDDEIKRIFMQIRENCDEILRGYFVVPETATETDQPDQKVAPADQTHQPQG